LEGDVSDIDLALEESDDESDAIQSRSLHRDNSRAAMPVPKRLLLAVNWLLIL